MIRTNLLYICTLEWTPTKYGITKNTQFEVEKRRFHALESQVSDERVNIRDEDLLANRTKSAFLHEAN